MIRAVCLALAALAATATSAHAAPGHRVGESIRLTPSMSVSVIDVQRTPTIELKPSWTRRSDEGTFVQVRIDVTAQDDGAVNWTNWNQTLDTWDGRERVQYSLSPALEAQGGNAPIFGIRGVSYPQTLVYDIAATVTVLGVYLRPGVDDTGVYVAF